MAGPWSHQRKNSEADTKRSLTEQDLFEAKAKVHPIGD
jgi:hypothetical protein